MIKALREKLPKAIHPKCPKSFIFFIIAALVCFELGNSIRNIVNKSIYSLEGFNNSFFSFVYAKNSGGAFSIFQNSANILAIFGIIALVVIAWYVYKKLDFQNKIQLLICIFFAGGVLGNTVERLQNGYVVDFIKLNFIDFPVFNFFDIMISASVVFYALFFIFGEKLFKRGALKVGQPAKRKKDENIPE